MSYLLMEQGRFLNGMCLLAVNALSKRVPNAVCELIPRRCDSANDSFSIHFARSFVRGCKVVAIFIEAARLFPGCDRYKRVAFSRKLPAVIAISPTDCAKTTRYETLKRKFQ